MANFIPVVIALIVNIYQQSSAPLLSWLVIVDDLNVISRLSVLLSTFFLILDSKIPDRYRKIVPLICALIIDYLVTHIAMTAIMYVWTQFQSMLCVLLKELLTLDPNDPKHLIYHQLGGDIFLGYFTTAMSVITLWYSFKATDSKDRFKKAFFTCIDTVVDVSIKMCECSDDENVPHKK